MKFVKNCYSIFFTGTIFRTTKKRELNTRDIDDVLFNRYRILKRLGTGAFGIVYLVEHINLKVLRAVKCIKLCQDQYGTSRREADILKNLRHPSIPIIYDIEESNGYMFIFEEYMEGLSLTEFISQRKKVNTKEAINIILKICKVLNYLHSNHIFHLDIKPENILIDSDEIKLLDYGNAINEEENPIIRMGTKGYASPEMYGKEKIKSASDVYSLGVIMLFLLTGRKDIGALRECKGSIRNVIDKCLCHTGTERITSCEELEHALSILMKGKFVDDGTVNIHIGGSRSHCGCTHCALSISRIMRRRGFKSIVCEKNDSGDFHEMVKEKDFIFNQGIFTMGREQIVPNYDDHVDMNFLQNFNRVIWDFGAITSENLEEFLKGDVIYIVTGGTASEIIRYKEMFDYFIVPPMKKGTKLRTLINLTDVKRYKEIVRRYGITNPVRVPYEPDWMNCKKDWLT